MVDWEKRQLLFSSWFGKKIRVGSVEILEDWRTFNDSNLTPWKYRQFTNIRRLTPRVNYSDLFEYEKDNKKGVHELFKNNGDPKLIDYRIELLKQKIEKVKIQVQLKKSMSEEAEKDISQIELTIHRVKEIRNLTETLKSHSSLKMENNGSEKQHRTLIDQHRVETLGDLIKRLEKEE